MGEANQRKANASVAKVIEASDQERIALQMFLERLVTPDGRTDRRRHERLFENFDLDAAGELARDKVKADGDQPITVFSGALVEYETTMDVLEYLLKVTDAKVPGPWSRPMLRLEERALGLKEGTYRAPSVKAADATPADATPAQSAAV